MTDGLGHRRGTVELLVTDENDMPLPDQRVVVEQRTHAFSFGNIGFDLVGHAVGEEDRAELAEDWLSLFNTALPFYWGDFEPQPGQPRTARLNAAAAWFRARGVRLKGHPLVWHSVKPPWLDPLPIDQVDRLIRQRVSREVSSFRGLIDTWDAINETVILPVFTNEPDGIANAITRLAQSRGRLHVIRLAFDEARAADPGAILLLNDFDLSDRYVRVISEALDAGVHIDGIGLQTHMHQGYWGEQAMLEALERFTPFGLPLHLTETTLLPGDLMPPGIVDLNDYRRDDWPSTPDGEERQAEEIVRHYRSLFAHPAVAAITYWGITDRDAWLNAPVGLIRRDGTHKPATTRCADSSKRSGGWRPQR